MKKLTTIEMTLTTCPNCLSENDGAAAQCSRCGHNLVVKERIIEDVDDSIMPEAEKTDCPRINSPVFPPEYPGTDTTSLVATFILFIISIIFLYPSLGLLIPAKLTFRIVSVICFLGMIAVFVMLAPKCYVFRIPLILFRQWRCRRTIALGCRYDAEILGYGRRDIDPRASKVINHGTMSVLTKIDGVETIVTFLTPTGVSSMTHPVGEHVAIIGYGRYFTLYH
ncbi:MAG: hypothetical protein J5845_08730 [Lachnospiraceae bacterium]|nr:hypothetical protein [Lachnospiraceae bacterium]